MEEFQRRRGLRDDAVCGPQTWATLVEAGYRLGDRLLYYSSPLLRGDDVAELQRRLGALGFDAGRLDGIFGPDTQAALLEFQRNAGLTTDAVCGPTTREVLDRLASRTDEAPVAEVRERERLRRSPPTLHGRRIIVGDLGGAAALAQAVRRELSGGGAFAVVVPHPDPSAQAAQANGVGADAYLGLASTGEGCSTAFYAAHGYVSEGGKRLAQCVEAAISPVLGAPAEAPSGMAVPVLRETRMPAVLCELGPPSVVVERGADLAKAFGEAFTSWVEGLGDV